MIASSNEAPVDLAAVLADDALLDMLGASRVAMRWAAERIDRATAKIPQSSEEREPLAYEFWRGYRAAATETAQTLRDLAAGGSQADADLICALRAWRREVDAEPIGELVELRRFSRLYRVPVTWLLGEEDDPPLDAVLVAAIAHLSDADQESVVRFARFLAQQATAKEETP